MNVEIVGRHIQDSSRSERVHTNTEEEMNAIAMGRSTVLRLTSGLAVVALSTSLAAPVHAAEDQTIVPPSGDYKVVEVVLEKGHPQEGDLVLRGGIRDGKLMVPDSTSVRLKAGELAFTADAVTGESTARCSSTTCSRPARCRASKNRLASRPTPWWSSRSWRRSGRPSWAPV